jgi:hypothetical protein
LPTEFTKLNHSIITPIFKSKGYRKIGPYCYGGTFDEAVYKKNDITVKIYYSTHPYDYPETGVRIIIFSSEKEIHNKLYPFTEYDLPKIMDLMANDLINGTKFGI